MKPQLCFFLENLLQFEVPSPGMKPDKCLEIRLLDLRKLYMCLNKTLSRILQMAEVNAMGW